MGHRTSLVSFAVAASVVGALAGVGLGRAAGVAACDDTRSSFGGSAAVSMGVGLLAVVGADAVVDIAADRRRLVDPVSTEGAEIVRHVAAEPGIGTAYVVDRRGADQVVMVTPARTITLEQPGEATHPSWSTDGRLVWSLGSRLRVWSPHADTFDVPTPPGTLGAFSPVFDGDDAIVAIVAEHEPGFLRTEDEGVDNLWRFDLIDRHWERLTAFHARGDRFVAIRTPILRADGTLEFVQIGGRSSLTALPAFALWRISKDGVATQVRPLPREMYLAGTLGGRRVWNIFDQAAGEWRLYAERSPTTLVDLGCGAAMVDPRSVDDPDRTPARPELGPVPTLSPGTPIPTQIPTIAPTSTDKPTTPPSPEDGYRSGVLVGDFSTLEAASAAAADIRSAFGEAAVVEVVDSAIAPNIVRPGVWAAVLLVPDGTDALVALSDLRSRLPAYQDWSWVVSV